MESKEASSEEKGGGAIFSCIFYSGAAVEKKVKGSSCEIHAWSKVNYLSSLQFPFSVIEQI